MLEREADTFAVNLLAPMTIINRLPSIQTKTDFMELCDLSGEASDNCIEELQMLKSGKKLPFPIKEEDVLHRLFFGSSMSLTGRKCRHSVAMIWR